MRVVALEEHFTVPDIVKRIDPAVIKARGFIPRKKPKDRAAPLDLAPEIGEIRLTLADVLEEESRNPRFLAEPVEAQVARMCELFDLPAPASVATPPAPADSS